MTISRSARQELRNFLRGYDLNYFITFNFGYKIRDIDARRPIIKFGCAMDRRALGNLWHRRTGDVRMTFFAFGENMDVNPHWHALAYVPQKTAPILKMQGPPLWKRWQPRGQLWIEKIKDKDKVIAYCTKRELEADALDRLIIYAPKP